MKTTLTNWSIMRCLRIVVGIAVFAQAYIQKDLTMCLLASLLLLTAIANIGCCGSNGCAVNYKEKLSNKEADVNK